VRKLNPPRSVAKNRELKSRSKGSLKNSVPNRKTVRTAPRLRSVARKIAANGRIADRVRIGATAREGGEIVATEAITHRSKTAITTIIIVTAMIASAAGIEIVAIALASAKIATIGMTVGRKIFRHLSHAGRYPLPARSTLPNSRPCPWPN
jgi:hypothetical protein